MTGMSAELDQIVAQRVSQGWTVEARTDSQAVMHKGKRPNHILHLILSILTVGVWVPVWIFLSLVQKPQHLAVTVGADGAPPTYAWH